MDPKRLVGAPRFELGTPCTPCKCATRLRHAPTRLFFFDSKLNEPRDRGPSRAHHHTRFYRRPVIHIAALVETQTRCNRRPKTPTAATPSTAPRAPASPASQSAGS